ncbi:MAG: 2-C-methyl-D-erythritol 4-phosphate cytidylyltransferase [Erysipelotrichaceae bacterium]|nr:2-C-methyl-D-erythritol 4-phosphate cytidylyltransferase [Erysipelotrichaceae bacterium]
MNYDVIIVASGKGIRANLGYNKAFYQMKDGRTVLEHAASLFNMDKDCRKIIIVTGEDCIPAVNRSDKTVVVKGGEERTDSVRNGLKEVTADYVLIHDAARPFLHPETLELLKQKVYETGAAIPGKKATDTIKIIDGDKIIRTIDRRTVFLAETPQGFKTDLIRECYRKSDGIRFTDEASLVEAAGYTVSIVEDIHDNRKLTLEEDFIGI